MIGTSVLTHSHGTHRWAAALIRLSSDFVDEAHVLVGLQGLESSSQTTHLSQKLRISQQYNNFKKFAAYARHAKTWVSPFCPHDSHSLTCHLKGPHNFAEKPMLGEHRLPLARWALETRVLYPVVPTSFQKTSATKLKCLLMPVDACWCLLMPVALEIWSHHHEIIWNISHWRIFDLDVLIILQGDSCHFATTSLKGSRKPYCRTFHGRLFAGQLVLTKK